MRFHITFRTLIGLTLLSLDSAAATADDALITGPIRQFTAPQGFEVVLARADSPEGTGRAIVGIYTRTGQSVEAVPGMAHMMEHIFANSAAFERVGEFPPGSAAVDSNAQARPDYVSAWLTVNRPDGTDAAPFALALRSSMKLWGVDATPDIIEEQRQRVIDELGRGLSSGSFLSERALAHAFQGNRPEMSEEIAITRDYDPEDLLDFLADSYTPDRVVLVVAGDIDGDAMQTALIAAFNERGEISQPDREPRPDLFRDAEFVGDPGAIVRTSTTAQGDWVAAGVPVPTEGREELALLIVDQLLLGGRGDFESLWSVRRDINSPLGLALQDTGPIDYLGDGRGYGAASPPLAEGGPAYFTIAFGADEMDVSQAGDRLRTALGAIDQTGFTDEEILSARAALIDFYRRWLNAPNLRPLADHLGGMALYDPRGAESLLSLDRDLASITPDEVRAAFERYFVQGEWRYGILDGVTPDEHDET